MNKHTPTPWRIGKGHCVVADEPVPGMDGSDAIEYYGGHLIAESITTENCEHIVRCVNSHEPLVEKLRANHRAVDWLMAKLILLDPTFLPSKSPIWPDVKGTADLLSQVDQ